MSISGIGIMPEPQEPSKATPQITNEENKQKYSIFDEDKDGTVTVKEQLNALRKAAVQDEIIKQAIEKGFDLEMYIQIFGEICEDIKTNTSQTIDKLIVTPQQMVEYANRTIQELIDNIKDRANEYLQPKPEKTAPTNIGKGWGMEDEHAEYIFDKLQKNGIAPTEIDIDLLMNIIARYDYDMDNDSDGILTTSEMNQYNDGGSHKYMDKDVQGNIKDTKVLDWIINKYLEKSKQ